MSWQEKAKRKGWQEQAQPKEVPAVPVDNGPTESPDSLRDALEYVGRAVASKLGTEHTRALRQFNEHSGRLIDMQDALTNAIHESSPTPEIAKLVNSIKGQQALLENMITVMNRPAPEPEPLEIEVSDIAYDGPDNRISGARFKQVKR